MEFSNLPHLFFGTSFLILFMNYQTFFVLSFSIFSLYIRKFLLPAFIYSIFVSGVSWHFAFGYILLCILNFHVICIFMYQLHFRISQILCFIMYNISSSTSFSFLDCLMDSLSSSFLFLIFSCFSIQIFLLLC